MPPIGLQQALVARRTRQGGSATNNTPLTHYLPSGNPSYTPAPAAAPAAPSQVLTYQGSPVAPNQLVGGLSVPDILNHPNRYLTSAGELRAQYLNTKTRKAAEQAKAQKQPSLLSTLDRGFGPNETVTAKQAALLAESVGLPGKTYAQIAQGESGLRPGARNPDDNTPSLWQMTPSVQSPETVAKWDQIASRHPGGYTNPVVAAKQAAYLAGEGTGVSNYYGTGFVTDPNAHLKGGQQRAQQILGSGGGGPQRKPLSTSELFYDPGISLKDGQETAAIGGHEDHVHYASESPRSILQAAKIAERIGITPTENPAFGGVEPVHTGGSYHYQEMDLPDRLGGLAKKVGAEGDTLGQAIDLSGTPDQMAELDQRLARRSGATVTGGGASTTMSSLGGSGATGSVLSGATTLPAATQRAAAAQTMGLRDVLGGAGGAAPSSAGGALAARAPQPRTRQAQAQEQAPEDPSLSVYDLLARFGRVGR